MHAAPARPIPPIRWALLAVLGAGLLGTGTELLLLGHTEDWRQWIPLGLIGIALLAVLWHAAVRSRRSLRILQVTMVLCIVAGLLGFWWHYQGNVEWERESDPDLTGLPLFGAAMTGALPALAPGAMIQLGLLGLVYGFRHPCSRRTTTSFVEE
jgi:hypothetical protein